MPGFLKGSALLEVLNGTNMNSSGRNISVYADGTGVAVPKLLGHLYAEIVRGKELFSFVYDNAWLSSKQVQYLDPDLHLYRGRQYPQPDKPSFGLFLDSSPDRWGRLLMRRREAIQARKGSHAGHPLSESDYLLGVHDVARMGALRLKTDEAGPFLAVDSKLATPPWTSLRELEQAARGFEAEDDNIMEERWLNLLLAPGSSLGGARPKASVMDPAGSLWIAKFPAKQDEEDSGAWEMVVHDLAVCFGLHAPKARLERFSQYGSTFLVKRFDRTMKKERIHFASAMALLGKSDGMSAQDGASYLELVEFIIRAGSAPQSDLEELWKRIVFNIAVSNTDDHLRNHGFLLDNSGWQLSPVYDVNPCPYGTGLSLNISEDDNSLDFDLALAQASFFQIEHHRANNLIEQILATVSGWKQIASTYGIARSSIKRMERAFHYSH